MRAVKRLARGALRRVGLEPINPARGAAPLYREDQSFHAAYERARERTGGTRADAELRRHRYYTLVQLVRQSPLTRGDVCELGCFRGLSSYQIAEAMVAEQAPGALHLFDSFEGLSPRDEADGPQSAAERRGQPVPASLETVQRSLSEFPFIEFHPGWIPERFRDVADRQFAFVHVDVVRYQPIRDSFMYFYPRLVDGGVMVFDDYGYTQFAGAKKAVDDGLAHFGHPFFVTLPSGQAFVIKGVPR
jgi:O-methyltransferase